MKHHKVSFSLFIVFIVLFVVIKKAHSSSLAYHHSPDADHDKGNNNNEDVETKIDAADYGLRRGVISSTIGNNYSAAGQVLRKNEARRMKSKSNKSSKSQKKCKDLKFSYSDSSSSSSKSSSKKAKKWRKDNKRCKKTKTTKYTDVLIIGAGMAGIRAAARINEVAPDLEVTILEASHRIGGRVESLITPDGIVLQKGANWLNPGGPTTLLYETNVNPTGYVVDSPLNMTVYEIMCPNTNDGSDNRRSLRASFGIQKAERVLERLHKEDQNSIDDSTKDLVEYHINRMIRRIALEMVCISSISKPSNLVALLHFLYYICIFCTVFIIPYPFI
jgi:Protoporphyrinogen oxidase